MAPKSVASLILGQAGQKPDSCADGSVVIDIDLKVFDKPLTGRIIVADRPAGLAEVVPVARTLADEITRRTISQAEQRDTGVTCGKGCAACCRYLVPLSVPEILQLCDELLRLPPTQQARAAAAFADTLRRILNAGHPPVRQTELTADEDQDTASSTIIHWYAKAGIDCPFLAKAQGTCTIYPSRPIACREHMVVSPARHCLSTNPDMGRRLEPPFSVAEALAKLAGEMEGAEIESVMLPLALTWHQANPVRGRRKWPAPILFERFAAIVHDLASRRLAASA